MRIQLKDHFKVANLKVTLFAILFCGIQLICVSQPSIEWQLSLGGSDQDVAEVVLENPDGSIILMGTTWSSDNDVSENYGGADVWVVKLSNLGEILWERSYGGTLNDGALSAKLTSDGGYIVSGYTASNDGDVASGNWGGRSDAWIFKLDHDGNLLWENTFGGSGWERGWAVEFSPDGGYFLFVETDSDDGDVLVSYDQSDFWLIKVDSVGIMQWQKTYGGSFYDFPENMYLSDDGELVLSGDTGSSDGDVGTDPRDFDYWIIKLDSLGSITFNQLYGGSNKEYDPFVQKVGDNEIIMCGTSRSADGDVSSNHGEQDLWVVKLDELGDVEWENNYGGSQDEGFAIIKQTIRGNYIIAGNTESQDFDVGQNYGGSDIWMIEIDSLGNLLWEQNYGGSSTDVPKDLTVLADGSVIVTGITTSMDGDITQSFGQTDLWVVKFSNYLDVKEDFSKVELNVYPNPTTSNIDILINDFATNWNVELFDMYGNIVFSKQIDSDEFSIEDIQTGVFILKVSNDELVGIQRVVVE